MPRLASREGHIIAPVYDYIWYIIILLAYLTLPQQNAYGPGKSTMIKYYFNYQVIDTHDVLKKLMAQASNAQQAIAILNGRKQREIMMRRIESSPIFSNILLASRECYFDEWYFNFEKGYKSEILCITAATTTGP